jgi:hypothetical protein
MINSFDNENNNKDFDKFINVNVYINGLFLIEREEDRLVTFKINLSNFQNHKKECCDIIRPYIEDKVKKYIVRKIKENTTNIVEMSRKYKIPIKNILYSMFINNRIDNIDIIWGASSIKEFRYVPVKHYIDFEEDSLYLKTSKFKFKKSF